MALLLEHQTQLQKHIAKIPKVSLDRYRYWLFQEPHSLEKDHLLELTLLQCPIKEEHHVYYQTLLSEENFLKTLKIPLTKEPSVYFSKSLKNYQNEGHFYLETFESEVFGANFRGFCEKNEERLFCEFPILAHLCFAAETNHEKIVTPFLIPHVKRALVVKNSSAEFLDSFQEPYVHLLGISHFSLKSILMAFEGAAIFSEEKRAAIHVPLTDPKKTNLFLVAAILCEIDIIFEGVENETLLEECKKQVATYKTAADLKL